MDREFYEIDKGDYFWDNGAAVGFNPRNESKIPFRGWHRKTVCPQKREWKRLKEQCNFIVKQRHNITYYVYTGDKKLKERRNHVKT